MRRSSTRRRALLLGFGVLLLALGATQVAAGRRAPAQPKAQLPVAVVESVLSQTPTVSGDGRWVVYTGTHELLAADATNPAVQENTIWLKDREHDDAFLFGDEVDQVGKPSDLRAADVAMLDAKAQRMLCRKLQASIDLCHEPPRQPGLPVLIPKHGCLDVGLSGGPKGNRQRHDLIRALIELLTSGQGTTSSGCRW